VHWGAQVIVRDLRPGAQFPLVFDTWMERVAHGSHGAVMRDAGFVTSGDDSTAHNNSGGVDAALLAELCAADPQASALLLHQRPPAQEHDHSGRLSESALRPSDSVQREVSSSRVTDALHRLEGGLHLEDAVERHRGQRTVYADDSLEAQGLLMAGADLSVDNWDGPGESHPAALFWKSEFNALVHSAVRPCRSDLASPLAASPGLGGALSPAMASSHAVGHTHPQVPPVLHIQVSSGGGRGLHGQVH
jgi:hypothetical protein